MTATVKAVTVKAAAVTRTKAPSVATMTRWMSTGRAKATDGCWTDPDGACSHGKPSWILTLGYI